MDKENINNISDDGTKIYRPLGKRFSVGEHLADIPFSSVDDMHGSNADE